MSGGVIESAHNFAIQLRESANDGSDFANGDTDYRVVFLGEDGQLHAKDSSGTVTDIGGAVSDILDLTTAEMTTTKVLAPDGAGGVEFRAEAGGSGLAPGQAYAYPTTFTGDTINGSSTTPFVDVAAFDTKEVLNSRVLHLVTSGQTKDQRVRVTLGTTKAAAFDVRINLAYYGVFYSATDDTYAEVRLSTAADGQLAIARILAETDGAANPQVQAIRVGGSSITSAQTNIEPTAPVGTPTTLRISRDGSNVIKFQFGYGLAPLGLGQLWVTSGRAPYTVTQAGTLARIELAMHTPTGPTADQSELFVDYVASV